MPTSLFVSDETTAKAAWFGSQSTAGDAACARESCGCCRIDCRIALNRRENAKIAIARSSFGQIERIIKNNLGGSFLRIGVCCMGRFGRLKMIIEK